MGITLIAGQGNIDIQAQAGTLQVAAKGNVHIQSRIGAAEWAAAKRIVLSVGGVTVTLEGGNITIECPGTIYFFAGQKSFTGPEKVDYPLPIMPREICVECLKRRMAERSAFVKKGT